MADFFLTQRLPLALAQAEAVRASADQLLGAADFPPA
jgi:hypothetical protein